MANRGAHGNGSSPAQRPTPAEEKQFKEMNETKLTRLIEKLIEWGLIKRLGHNSYQLERDNIADFV